MEYPYPQNSQIIQPPDMVLKKERSEKQRLANQRRSEINRNLAKTLKNHGMKANFKTRHALRQWRMDGKSNNSFFKGIQSNRRLSVEQPFQEFQEKVPIPVQFPDVQNTKPKIVKPSGHALAGKKAESSLKGKAWLDDVKKAKELLDKVLTEAGAEKKGQQMDARKLASMLRKNPETAQQFVSQVLTKTLKKKHSN